MATSTSPKGNSVNFVTFKAWELGDVIGYKTTNENGKDVVNFVWCNVCARNEHKLLLHPNLKGSAKVSVQSYIKGTNYVSKHTLHRHLDSEGHKIALSCEQSKPSSERLSLGPRPKAAKVNRQPLFVRHLIGACSELHAPEFSFPEFSLDCLVCLPKYLNAIRTRPRTFYNKHVFIS